MTASDFWGWTFGLDMPEGIVGDNYVIYMWATLTNQDDAEEVFTIACKRTVGDDTTFQADYYTQGSTTNEVLFPDNAEVTPDKTWSAQAVDYKEEDDDHKWTATSDHSTLVGDSATAENKIYGCYVAMEMSKIGRNPADFDKTYDVSFGARIYSDDAATTFDTIPTQTTSFFFPLPEEYYVEK